MECQSAGWRIPGWMLLTRSVWEGATFYLVFLYDFQSFLHSNNFGFLVVVSHQTLSFSLTSSICWSCTRCSGAFCTWLLQQCLCTVVPLKAAEDGDGVSISREQGARENLHKGGANSTGSFLLWPGQQICLRTIILSAVSQCSFILAEYFLMSP